MDSISPTRAGRFARSGVLPALVLMATCLPWGVPALAGAHGGGEAPAGGGRPIPEPDAFYYHTGFDGREAQLGAAVVEAIRKAGPERGEGLNFSPEQQRMLGQAVAKAIKTLSNDGQYQHEINDALVKAELTKIQFAKDKGLLQEVINHEVRTQMPMLTRVGRWMQEGGSPELGIIALTERTACFYQLVLDYERQGTTVRWKAPYANVLAVTTRLGQHNLSNEEIHRIWTIPIMRQQAAVMGMELEISDLSADGWVTMSVRRPEGVATAN